MKWLRRLAFLSLIALGGCGVAWLATAPELPADDSTSGRVLAARPYEAGNRSMTFVDAGRPTQPNGSFEGAPERTLVSTLWYPNAAPGPHPLVVYSHGFGSFRGGGAHIGEHLASRGYVVVAADFPLTTIAAPGGPMLEDVANQPGDVSFLIDQLLAWSEAERPFEGEIDRERIGLAGISLGGLTTTLATFHPGLRDERVKAAVSIAGPIAMFERSFFEPHAIPFLMIGGTEDAMVDYATNAALVPDRVPTGALLTLEAASHAGFSAPAAGIMRILGHSDRIGCIALMGNLDAQPGENPFAEIGGAEIGMIDDPPIAFPCERPLGDAMKPGRQHAITLLAVSSFFESHFAPDAATRADSRVLLERTLAAEFPEVEYTARRLAMLRE